MIDDTAPPKSSKPPYDFGPNSKDVTSEQSGTIFGIVGAPKSPLVFPADWRDTTDEHAGTIIGLVGAEAVRAKPTKPADDPAA
jgi:hypothetical protein